MGIFDSKRFSRPGPGIPKGLARKKGIPRFFELLARDSGTIMKVSFIQTLSYIPIFLLYLFGVSYTFPLFLVCFAAIGVYGLFLGPCCTACTHAISNSLRDAPDFFWDEWKKTFKGSFRQTATIGVVYSLFCALQLLALFTATNSGSPVFVALLFVSALLFHAIMSFFFLQAGYLTLSTGGLLKNSILLALSHLPRSLAGTILPLLGGIFLIMLPSFVLVAAVFGTGLLMLWQLTWIWPPINEFFHIEEEFDRRNAELIEDVEKIDFRDPTVSQ